MRNINFFPDHPVLAAGIGNNPPADSTYWREDHWIRWAIRAGRKGKTWSEYCQRAHKMFNFFKVKQ